MKVIEQKPEPRDFIPVSLILEDVIELEEICDMLKNYYLGKSSAHCKLEEILLRYKQPT